MSVWDEPEIFSLSSRAARIRYKVEDYHEPAWLNDVFLAGTLEPIIEPQFQGHSDSKTIQIACNNKEVFKASHPKRSITGVKHFRFYCKTEALFYGCGEWFNGFARRAGKLNLLSRDSPAIIQWRQTYSNIPLMISNQQYGIFLLNSYPSRWKFNSQKGYVDIGVKHGNIDFLLFTGSPGDILDEFSRLTGRPPLVPRWAFGLWLTSYPQEDQNVVVNLVEQHRQRGIPLDAVILDYHWEERFHNFKFRKSLIPDPVKMVRDLKKKNSRLGLIITPFTNRWNEPVKKWIINTLLKDIPLGHEKDDETDPIAYDEGVQRGYFAHTRASWWFGKGGMVDFTNPEACQWWHDRMEPLYRMGVDFFKNDDGEYLPADAHSHIGLDASEYHNLYGFYYGKSIFEKMENLDDRRGLVYARSVWAGSQRYPGMFLGDQKPDFSHMRQAIRAGLNMSMMGNAYWTADVFGLDGRTDPQTHLRHAQWSLFMPIARYFVRPDRLDGTRTPWAQGTEAEESFKRHVELRYRLLPYYYQLARQAHLTGKPIIRPMVMEFPQDSNLWAIDDQFMLGDQILFAPVLERDTNERKVIFPAGKWYSYWSGKEFTYSHSANIRVDKACAPIFIRENAILPMIPPRETIPDDFRFESITLNFWPPYSRQVELYDDDGASRAYQNGEYQVLPIRSFCKGSEVEVEIGPGEGDFKGAPKTMYIELCFPVDRINRLITIKNMSTLVEWTCIASNDQTVALDYPFGMKLSVRIALVV
jgi:alpha-D-xyloside xylohydrolase